MRAAMLDMIAIAGLPPLSSSTTPVCFRPKADIRPHAAPMRRADPFRSICMRNHALHGSL
jgi:hypothetical protein